MIKIALSGAGGRMGRTVYKSLTLNNQFEIVFGVDPYPTEDLPFPVYQSFDHCPLGADVILDFSSASALDGILDYAVKTGTKCVLATTGYTDEQLKRIRYASKQVAVFHSANMSLGINLLANLSKEAMKFLGDNYDVEIVETHHNKKLDSPSGTALTLANAINSVRENELTHRYGRHESAKRREKNEIGIHAIRGGTVVGKHDVMFLGAGEQVKLSHEAESKEVFVRGALRAISFLTTKQTGLYDMNSILGSYYAVTSVTSEKDVSVLYFPTIKAEDFIAILRGIKDQDINLDMISQSVNLDGTLAVSFSLSDNDLARAETIAGDIHHTSVVGKAKLTAEGAGMEHTSGVALDVLSILKGLGAVVHAITTSETKISCCVDMDKLSQAENALRQYYKI